MVQIVHADDVPWSHGQEKHRSGGLIFRNLFKGTPGTPENFRLVISRHEGVYTSPRHRHNFDQVRFCLTGSLNVAPRVDLAEGEVGYFPEGAYYGPQVDSNPGRLSLTLQCGGASGQGFLSSEELRRGFEELSTRGRFEDGIYHHGDSRRKQDSFEAIWEHVNGRRLEYPEPRYTGPILVKPENFTWLRIAEGVERRLLGVFTERGTRLEFLRIGAGATFKLGEPDAFQLILTAEGEGRCGAEPLRHHSAIRIEAGESAEVTGGDEALALFVITLPLIRQAAVSEAA